MLTSLKYAGWQCSINVLFVKCLHSLQLVGKGGLIIIIFIFGISNIIF